MTNHPLDPLSAVELSAVVSGLRSSRGLDHRHLLSMVQLHEPTKRELDAWSNGQPLVRAAFVTVWNREAALISEAVVSVEGEVISWTDVPGAQSPVLAPEANDALAAAKADPRVAEALARRGISSVDEVHMETWPFGAQIPAGLDDGRRLIWTPMWHRPHEGANVYAHPIGDLRVIVDLDTSEVLAIEEDALIPIPATPGPYRASDTGASVALKPLEITQPEGSSFTVDGWLINWERWSLRIGWCQREGLLIHDVAFNDNGTTRKIARRMSIAELVIPYGDPSPGAYRKNAFDTGEFGLGNYTNSLMLGCDCLGEIVYLDVALAEADGTVREIPNAICLHEEDFGILWKHTDELGHVEVRRGRRFVASSIVTVNNYEYGYFWYFYQDGSIEFEAKLTGIVLTLAGDPDLDYPSSTEIDPGLLAPYHQHIFSARLDLDIDGVENSVLEIDAVAAPMGPENPHGAAYTTRSTVLATESAAQRVIDPFANRYWKVINPNRLNHVGAPVGYKLVPGHTTYPMAQRESVIGKRAGFMYSHLWVTPNKEAEKYPAGDYPFQHEGGAGLPEWTAADRPLENTDVVLWYTFGTNHIPRTEDWPVMPVERVGFHLKPVGFFRRSPGNDVAPSQPKHCH
ncbi:MAG: primary-amine oxidase [Actinomycetes bacterium]